MPRPKPEISAEKLALFERMFLAGEDKREMAEALVLYHDRIKVMCAAMSPEHKRERHKNRVAILRNGKRPVRNVSTKEPTPKAWAERERRMSAPRTLTAEFCGDPRPGQSALDKMRASA